MSATSTELARPRTFSIREDWPLIIAWPIVGVVSLVLGGVARMLGGQDVAWLPLFWSTISWSEWLLLAPLIVYFARRWRFREGDRARSLILHTIAALAVWLAHSFLVYLTIYLMYGRLVMPGVATLRQDLTIRLPVWLLYDVLIYLTTWAATAAVDLNRTLTFRAVRQAQLRARVVEAELELMQMQVQPEFILGTLAAARGYAITDPRRCEALVGRLADVLRSSLETLGSDRVELEAELRHLRSWLAVDSLRADRPVEIAIECDADILHREVPKYLLTEVVSTAVGATQREQRVRVSIEAAGVDAFLALRVRIEAGGVGAVADAILAQLQTRLDALPAAGWTFQIDETTASVLALTFDRSHGLDESWQSTEELELAGGLVVGA